MSRDQGKRFLAAGRFIDDPALVLEREFDDFDTEAASFLRGEQTEEQFIGFRLKQGVYGQRQPDVQMIRVKLPMGGITPEQLEAFLEAVGERAAGQRRPRRRHWRPTGSAADAGAGAFTTSTLSWYYVSGLVVRSADVAGTVVTFGDSITDGANSTPDANHRWPDFLARRLHGACFPAVLFRTLNRRLSRSRS